MGSLKGNKRCVFVPKTLVNDPISVLNPFFKGSESRQKICNSEMPIQIKNDDYFRVFMKPKTGLNDISTPDFLIPSFNPGPFNPRLFNHELFNPGLFNQIQG